MKKRMISIMLCLTMIIVLLSGCGSIGGEQKETSAKATEMAKENTDKEAETIEKTSGEAEASGNPIEVAVITTSLTGSLATNGEYIMNGVNMALEEIAAAGGINGVELKATFLDDQVKASEAINATKKAVSEMKVPVILGPDTSGNILAIRGRGGGSPDCIRN